MPTFAKRNVLATLAIYLFCLGFSVLDANCQLQAPNNGLVNPNVQGNSAASNAMADALNLNGATSQSYVSQVPAAAPQNLDLAAGTFGSYKYIMRKDMFHFRTFAGFNILDHSGKNIVARLNPYTQSVSGGYYGANIIAQSEFARDDQFGSLLRSQGFLSSGQGSTVVQITGRSGVNSYSSTGGAYYEIKYFDINSNAEWFINSAKLIQQQSGRFSTRRSYVLALQNGNVVNIQSNAMRTKTSFVGSNGQELASVSVKGVSLVWKTTYEIKGQQISPFLIFSCIAAMVSN